MTKSSKRILILESAIALAVLMYCEWFFFRNVVGTGTGALIGDRSDGRLTTLLTEHWWNFFRGRESFSEIAMFYPAEGVFGYTDLFLGYGIIHSLFRLIGVNMFVSYKWTLIVIHFMGTISMYYLMRKKLKCNLLWSLFGTIAFSFSDTYARHLGHTQLVALSTLPILLILFIGFIRCFENRRKRNIYAYFLVVWFVLLTYNSWYIACLTGVFCLVFLIIYFVELNMRRVKVLSILKEKIVLVWKDAIGYIIFMGILYIPFIRIYLPVLRLSSGYSYDTCVQYLPELADIINVSETNWMLGKFIENIGLSSRGYSGEVTEGFSVILLITFLAMFFVIRKDRSNQSEYKKNDMSSINVFIEVLVKAVFVTIIVSVLLTIRLSSNGVSLWAIVYYTLPVVRSMRAVARFLLWLSFPMAVVTAYSANKLFRGKGIGGGVISGCAVALIFLSNINTVGVSQLWNYPEEMHFISGVSAPPEDAKVFYIIDTANTGDVEWIYQLDAFEIATWHSIKTVNGYSGQLPQDWSAIWNVCSESYENGVFNWINKHGLSNVYAYDRATDTWIYSEDRISTILNDVFSPIDNKFSLSYGLKDYEKGDFAWTSQESKIKIVNPKIKNTGLVVKMQLQRSWYMAQNPDLDPYIQLWVDGMLVQDIPVTDDYVELNIPMSDHQGDEYVVELKTNCYFNPKQIGLNSDARDLSIALKYIGS